MSELRVMIVAGERSGDVYGGQLAQALHARRPDITLFGCGGETMRRGGVETVADLRQFSMIGITEVISGLPGAYHAFRRLVVEAERRRPQLAVLIDSPSLNMRLARRLKQRGIPVLYFVSPQIWAWKKWRLRRLPELVDQMICIFDFEEAIYQKAGIPVEYVGHPLVESVCVRLSREQFFSRFELDSSLPIVALLPGSRAIEIAYNLPTVLDAARQLARDRNVQFALAVAPTLDAAQVAGHIRQAPELGARLRIVTGATYEALAFSTVAIVASGTATLEAALLERPMVVVYRVSPLTAFFARRMVDVPFFSMVNILAGGKIVEELIQKDFRSERLARVVACLLDQPELQLKMVEELRELKKRLGRGGAIERVAGAVLRMIEPSGTSDRTDSLMRQYNG